MAEPEQELSDEAYMQKEYGNITNATIVCYYKYQFTIEVETDKGFTLVLDTGGDHHSIYRYDAGSTDWQEHISASMDGALNYTVAKYPEEGTKEK